MRIRLRICFFFLEGRGKRRDGNPVMAFFYWE